jgi:transcriptional regulator GlxA family with amidase domain
VNIGIFIFDGAQELDFTGPWEVLNGWAREAHGEREITVFTVAPTRDPIRCANGLRVLADYSRDEAPRLDLLVFPGGRVRHMLDDARIHAWLQETKESGALMTSVCTGAHVFASAGILRDRPATTWFGALDALVAIDPTIELRRDERFVDSGEVVTSAGVSAGIDMALHLVSRLDSPERAESVRRWIQYETPLYA